MLFMPNGFADFRLKIMQLDVNPRFFSDKKSSSAKLAIPYDIHTVLRLLFTEWRLPNDWTITATSKTQPTSPETLAVDHT
jgi:hypothetical protein